MKSSNGHNAAVVEAGQASGLHGRRTINGKAAEAVPAGINTGC